MARTSCPRAIRSFFSVKPWGRPLVALAHALLREQTVSEMQIWTFLQPSQRSLNCFKNHPTENLTTPAISRWSWGVEKLTFCELGP